VHTNRSAGRALHRRSATAMAMPTTEKNPVTTAIPDTGIASPPSGTSKSTPTARASAAARVVAEIAARVAIPPVTTSLRRRWGARPGGVAGGAPPGVPLRAGAARRRPRGQPEPGELVVVEGDDLAARPAGDAQRVDRQRQVGALLLLPEVERDRGLTVHRGVD